MFSARTWVQTAWPLVEGKKEGQGVFLQCPTLRIPSGTATVDTDTSADLLTFIKPTIPAITIETRVHIISGKHPVVCAMPHI
jgi:hypothetical protein